MSKPKPKLITKPRQFRRCSSFAFDSDIQVFLCWEWHFKFNSDEYVIYFYYSFLVYWIYYSFWSTVIIVHKSRPGFNLIYWRFLLFIILTYSRLAVYVCLSVLNENWYVVCAVCDQKLPNKNVMTMTLGQYYWRNFCYFVFAKLLTMDVYSLYAQSALESPLYGPD